jgi:diacylglycerol kinase family enzyme
MGRMAHLDGSSGLLIVNPRSGTGSPTVAELSREAAHKGLDVHVLADGEDVQELAREATGPIGVAGGDGSLGPVAQVAMERDVPFVCIPFGTRNHFARDIGLDRRTRSARSTPSVRAVSAASTSAASARARS